MKTRKGKVDIRFKELQAERERLGEVKPSHTPTPWKVASWYGEEKKYYAAITANGKVRHIGSFDDPLKAAQAYDLKAKELHGEFAVSNFPIESQKGVAK